MINPFIHLFICTLNYFLLLCAKPTWSAGDYKCDCNILACSLGCGDILGLELIAYRKTYIQTSDYLVTYLSLQSQS